MKHRLTLFALCTFLALPASLAADQLLMNNGDRLTGEVVKKDGEVIEFKTPYGEPFKIQWKEVDELRTDAPVKTLMKDGEVAEVSSFSDTTTPRSDVDLIKPELWQTGEGWKWSGLVNFALKIERGNNDSNEYDFDGSLELRDLKNRFTFHGELENDESQGSQTKDKWKLINKYDRFLNKRLFLGGNISAERDKFADLTRRTTYGPHIGYQFYEETRINLSAELGALYVDERSDNSPDEDFWASGWGTDFDYYLIMDTLQFYHRNNGFWNMEDTDRFYVDSWTGLRWPIYAGVVGSTEIQVEYDSDPAEDADDYDTTYSLKLGYQW